MDLLRGGHALAQIARTCWVLFVILLVIPGTPARSYQTDAKRDPNKLNIHIICHTHDDAGWLKTFDQYVYGTRQDIQLANVNLILDSVMLVLQQNPNRKFNYAEMGFFSKWWEQQPGEVREVVKDLVAKGQLDFMNGGYVQHDEATAHYVAMIDQTSRGHRFLNSTFGKRVKVGWQIDPFGHSGTQASLMAALLGFEALVIGRADYQDMAARRKSHGMEMVWRGSQSWGSSADIWTHQNYDGNYSPFPGFNFDYGQTEAPIVDDENSAEYNLKFKVNWFVSLARGAASYTRGNDIIYTAGTDFTYTNAPYWYSNLDKLIHYVNQDGRVNVFYSTVSDFIEAKKNTSGVTWPLRTEDFFPYADSYHAFWTGYFTSRPTSKAFIRAATAFLQAARQLHVAMPGVGADAALDQLEAEVSLTQHHDAITGTEKQHVAVDYAARLARAWEKAEVVVNKALLGLMFEEGAREAPAKAEEASANARTMLHASRKSQPGRQPTGTSSHLSTADPTKADSVATYAALSLNVDQNPAAAPPAITLHQCMWINASICEESVSGTASGNGLLVVLYNSLAWPRTAFVRLPVAAGPFLFALEDSSGAAVPLQVLRISHSTKRLQQVLLLSRVQKDISTFGAQEVAFQATLPPLGYATYYLRQHDLPPAPQGPRSWPTEAGAARDRSTIEAAPGSNAGSIVARRRLGATSGNEAALGSHRESRVEDEAEVVAESQVAGANQVAGVHEVADEYEVAQEPLVAQKFQLEDDSEVVDKLPEADDDQATGLGLESRLAPAELGLATYQDWVDLDKAAVYGADASLQHGRLADGPRGPQVSEHFRTVSPEELERITKLPTPKYVRYSMEKPGQNKLGALGTQPGVQPGGCDAVDTQPCIQPGASGQGSEGRDVSISNSKLCVVYDGATGLLKSISAANSSWRLEVTHSFLWYHSSPGGEKENPRQASGAYIFRPLNDITPAQPIAENATIEVVCGHVVQEVRQHFADWATLITRLWVEADYLELEWTVGPIPMADGIGKEVVSRFTTNLQSEGVLWHDANGREMIRRLRDHRQSWNLTVTDPISGNFYPMTAGAHITDGSTTLSVVTERAQAVASLEDGQLEVMVHRALAVDDRRGVGEPLNETMCGAKSARCPGLIARGTHYLTIQPSRNAARVYRPLQHQASSPVIVSLSGLPTPHASSQAVRMDAGAYWEGRREAAGKQADRKADAKVDKDAGKEADVFDPATRLGENGQAGMAGSEGEGVWNSEQGGQQYYYVPGMRGRSSLLHADLEVEGLPANVELVTLMRTGPKELLLRLGHVFQVGEDQELAVSVKVDISKLLKNHSVNKITELSLSGAQYKSQLPPPYVWPLEKTASAASEPPPFDINVHADSGPVFELHPMEIRTFELMLV